MGLFPCGIGSCKIESRVGRAVAHKVVNLIVQEIIIVNSKPVLKL